MRSTSTSFAACVGARLRPGRPALFIIAAAFLGVALTLAREISYGPGFGPDQSSYVETARNLLEGEAFTRLHGKPYTLWAPLYPVLLAAASISVFDPRDVAGPLNAAGFGLLIIVAGKWLWNRLESRFLAVWSVLAVALSLPLAHAASIVFPIVFFTLFATLALINTDNFFRENRRYSLALAAMFSALAWLTHYTGIAVVVSVSALLAAHPQSPLSEKAKRIASYGLAGSTPIAIWALWIFYRTGEFTANRRPVDYYLPGLARDVIAEMSEWAFINLYVGNLRFYPEAERWPIAFALTAAALIALFIGVCYGMASASILRRPLHNPPSFPRRRGSGGLAAPPLMNGAETWARWSALFVFGGFALTYLLLYLVALMAGSTWTGAQPRHLLPVYLPLLIAVTIALDRFLLFLRNNKRPFALGALTFPFSLASLAMAVPALWLALAAALQPVAIRNANAYGIAKWDVGFYSLPRYVNSELIEHVRDQPPEVTVYSNVARALNLYAPRRPPPQHLPRMITSFPLWIAIAPDGASVAWFHATEGYTDYTAADLRATPGLEVVAELTDGAVFRVNGTHDPRLARQAAYAALAAREPVIRSAYDLYLDGRTLIYAKSPCSREETAARFFLHVTPISKDNLPNDRNQYGFDNLDFPFENAGVRFNETCIASVALPDYPIAAIRTGQFVSGKRLWQANFPFPDGQGGEIHRIHKRSAPPE